MRSELPYDLRPIREHLEWSQAQMGQFLGINQSAISRIESVGRIAIAYAKLIETIFPFTVTRTEDGVVVVFDPETGISVSRTNLADALAELRRLLTIREAA